MPTQNDITDQHCGESLIASIHAISHKLMILYSQIVFAQTGLNWQDWRILRAVVGLQSCRAQDICDECGLKKPHVSNGLARLERAGHVMRTKNPQNTRTQLVRSTNQGEMLVERAQPVLDGFNSQIAIGASQSSGNQVLGELRNYQTALDRLAKESGATCRAASDAYGATFRR